MSNKVSTECYGDNFSQFIGVQKVNKTLRNELIPTDNTRENIEKNGIISEDELRAEMGHELKAIMDDYYRNMIEETLSKKCNINWSMLFAAMDSVARSANKKDADKILENVQKEKREEIHKLFKEQENFGKSFSAKLVSDVLPDFIGKYEGYSVEERVNKIEVLKLFKGFMTSFKAYFDNRNNAFSKENISTSICHRVVNDNAFIFWDNLNAFKKIDKYAHDAVETIEGEISGTLGEWKISQIYSVDFFGMVISQSGITFYNEVSGEINKYMNIYCPKKNKTACSLN